MENDAIRCSGSNTLVDIWIDGKMRGVCVSKEAIGAILGFDHLAGMSDKDRCEFVRTHLPLIVTAAKTRLAATDPAAAEVVIDASALPQAGRAEDRRKGQRRSTARRKTEKPADALPQRNRRRGERRKGDRRRSPEGAGS
ncbi:MAG: hypothetical protein ACJ8D5_04200 [Sphingomicrobium sp.]